MLSKNKISKLIVMLVFIIIVGNFSIKEVEAVVNPNQIYTYTQMEKDIKNLKSKYPSFISYKSIGKTKYNRDIWAVRLGKGSDNIFINASHHGREWLTTNLVMEMLDVYADAYNRRITISGYNVRNLLDEVSIWFIPMVNPDGVTLQQYGPNAFPSSIRSKLISMNGGSTNFIRWKANAEGIDLNRQYPADWNNIKFNSLLPSYQNHKGRSPLVTNEAKAMVAFTNQIKPEIAVSYHSSGEILYWNFNTPASNYQRDYNIARKVSSMTGYRLVQPVKNPSGGGFTDWFIQEHKKPALTPEIGRYVYERSLPLSEFSRVWSQNKAVPLELIVRAKSLISAKTTPVNKTYTLFSTVDLYNSPNGSKTGAKINPQNIYVYNKKGNWLEVKTWIGKKWVNTKDIMPGSKVTFNKTMYLPKNANLYNSPTGKSLNSALKPQNIKVISKLGNWYEINTWLGKKWIYSTDIINGKLTPTNEPIHLFETVGLYNGPSLDGKVQGKLKPQTVRAISKLNDRYLIKTWLGNKWIKPEKAIIGEVEELNEKITLTLRKDLYEWPNAKSRKRASLNPQSVKAVAKVNNWYQVETWIGPMWITGKDILVGEPQELSVTLYSFEQKTLFKSPSSMGKKSGAIKPQKLQAVAYLNGWYRVNTWIGPLWITAENVDKFNDNKLQEINVKATLVNKKNIYDYPNTKSKYKGALNPQVVNITAKYDDWYRVKTWIGELWIDSNDVVEDVEQQINEKIILSSTTPIYESPTENSRVRGKLNPQQVTSIAKLGNWYKIKTWIGDKWIIIK